MFSKQLFGLEKNGSIKTWTIAVTNPVLGSGDVSLTISHGQKGGAQTTKTDVYTEGCGKQGRNTYEQAVFEAEARIKKQLDKNYRETEEELKYLPLLAMLAADYNKVGHRVKFPCYTSVKYDGVRCLASKHAGFVYLRSRTGQEFDVPSVSAALNEVMYDGEVLDGEIYLHGVELQDILSAVKRSDEKCEKEIERTKAKHRKACTAAGLQQNPPEYEAECEQKYLDAMNIARIRNELQFHIFDIPMDGDFEIRLASMAEHQQTRRSHPQVKYCVYNWCDSDQSLREHHHKEAVRMGFEGVMIRNLTGVYESGKRSADLQKYKTFLDEEFEIVETGVDKQGYIVFTLKNNIKSNRYIPGIRYIGVYALFECVMGDYAWRLEAAKNPEQFKGQFMNVQFQTRYKNTLLPQFPTGKLIREGDVVDGVFVPTV